MRKHRIIERLLTDFMGYTGYEAHERADELGDTFSDEMIERIDEKLGHPERCPHGWPVDTDVEQAENAALEPLAALEPGTRATIVRLAEHDGELLHWFYDQGLVPGQEIERAHRRSRPPTSSRSALDGGERAISREGRRRPLRAARAGLAREPALRELGGRVVDAVLGRLPLEPRGELGHAVRELDLGLVAERLLARARRPRSSGGCRRRATRR